MGDRTADGSGIRSRRPRSHAAWLVKRRREARGPRRARRGASARTPTGLRRVRSVLRARARALRVRVKNLKTVSPRRKVARHRIFQGQKCGSRSPQRWQTKCSRKYLTTTVGSASSGLTTRRPRGRRRYPASRCLPETPTLKRVRMTGTSTLHHAKSSGYITRARRPGEPRRRRRRRRRRRLGVVKKRRRRRAGASASSSPDALRARLAARAAARSAAPGLSGGDAGSSAFPVSAPAPPATGAPARRGSRRGRAARRRRRGTPRSRFPRRSPRWPRERPRGLLRHAAPRSFRVPPALRRFREMRRAGKPPAGVRSRPSPSSAPDAGSARVSLARTGAAAAFRRRGVSVVARPDALGFFVLRSLARAGSRPRRPRAGPRPRAGLGVGAADVRVGGRG